MKRAKSQDDESKASSSNASQLAGKAAGPPPALALLASSESSGASQLAAPVESAVCYPCALGQEIHKHVKCACCGIKRATVLMVGSPELWPAVRIHSVCARCKCEYSSEDDGVYILGRSASKWGNLPVCCDCYGVPTPSRHLHKQ